MCLGGNLVWGAWGGGARFARCGGSGRVVRASVVRATNHIATPPFCLSFLRVRRVVTPRQVLGGVPCLVLPAEGGVGGCFTVVYAHANAVDVGQITMMMKNLQLYCAREARLPVHVVAVEYPGYGVHKGSPTEASIDGAMARAAAALIGYGWPRERIVIFGRSIGTGPAVTLATELRPAALALVAPFTSMREVTGHIAALLTRLPLGVAHALGTLAVSDWWRSVDRAPRVMCPTLFIHGCTDRIVPCGHSIKARDLDSLRRGRAIGSRGALFHPQRAAREKGLASPMSTTNTDLTPHSRWNRRLTSLCSRSPPPRRDDDDDDDASSSSAGCAPSAARRPNSCSCRHVMFLHACPVGDAMFTVGSL